MRREIKAIIRPDRLSDVVQAFRQIPRMPGVTVSVVNGFGRGGSQAVGPLVGGEERLAFDILNGRMTVSGVTDARPRATLGIATGAAATFAGVATLWAAIAADMGVSLLVIGNALRLLNSEA